MTKGRKGNINITDNNTQYFKTGLVLPYVPNYVKSRNSKFRFKNTKRNSCVSWGEVICRV